MNEQEHKQPEVQADGTREIVNGTGNRLAYWWFAAAGVLVVIVGLAAFYLGQYSKSQSPAVNLPDPVTNPSTATTAPEQAGDLNEDLSVKGVVVEVDWLPELIPQDCPEGIDCAYIQYYRAGTIKNRQYAGRPLILTVEQSLGTILTHYAEVEKDGAITLVSLTGNPEQQAVIKGVSDIPETIDLPGTGYKLRKNYPNSLFSDLVPVRKLFTHPTMGDFYLMDNGCIMVELPDHTAVAYDLVLPFVNQENGQLSVTFLESGKVNTDAYSYNAIVGCGALCYYLKTMEEEELNPGQRLVIVARTAQGENFYGLANESDKAYEALYNDKNTVAYFSDTGNWENLSKSKYTYQQFLNYQPLLFWKDPLGRWIEFKNRRFELAAEMCKPVIYLYPTAEQELEIKVRPNGGFTYTLPEYGSGWRVKAGPEGKIVNLADGREYPYLFWEGIGLNYPEAREGFVVKRENVAKFFDEKLALLGLNEREAKDFKEYWVNRLTEKLYYKVAFLKKTQFDEIAPLQVSPVQPNTVIRVMVTAEGLDAPVNIKPQQLEMAPERRGFVLVEWGGVVLK